MAEKPSGLVSADRVQVQPDRNITLELQAVIPSGYWQELIQSGNLKPRVAFAARAQRLHDQHSAMSVTTRRRVSFIVLVGNEATMDYHRLMRLLTLLFAATSIVLVAQSGERSSLDIYVIDVEGGEATLFVSPSGESMLVDTGWPGFNGRDADRIVAAAADVGVTELDYLLVTHFHTDHMGGALQLAERMPIHHFIDHGSSTNLGERGQAAFDRYAQLRAGGEHLEVKPGDRVPVTGIDVRIIASSGDVLREPLAGAGNPNPACRDFVSHGEDITSRGGDAEDQLSVSVIVAYEKFRTIIMGDLTWNKEYDLMCPNDTVGMVDAYLVSHHGAHTSGSEALVHALQPRAAIMNNGPRKGGAVQTFAILNQVPSLEHLWQNHYAVDAGNHNSPDHFIANLDTGDNDAAANGQPVHTGASHWIRVSAQSDGSFTVTNSRNGHRQHYPPRP